MSTDRRCVIVTGASSGIGQAIAVLLARRGLHVFGGVRNDEAARALEETVPGFITAVEIDVRREETAHRAAALVTQAVEDGKAFVGLVNNAGVPLAGPLEFLPLDQFRDQIEVNLIGALAVTQAFMPLARSSQGRIININSISGWTTFPYLGPYAASKAALRVLDDALRLEVRPWGIRVASIFPGRVSTPIWGKASAAAGDLAARLPVAARELYAAFFDSVENVQPRGIRPGQVAEAVAHALLSSRPKRQYLVGRDAYLLMLLAHLPGRLREGIIHAMVRKRK